MTHKDILTKFMIEYDKANVTSSYPSLTDYEIATILDKAYNALIAQKFTGNNVRKMPFEGDTKAIEDIAPLIEQDTVSNTDITDATDVAPNVKAITLPDHLYYIGCYLPKTMEDTPADEKVNRMVPVQLVTHQIATKFYSTAYNLPWIKIPVGYIEGSTLYVVYDPIDSPLFTSAQVTYIKAPAPFINASDNVDFTTTTLFECSDSVAEELINLAISFALENVESQRLSTKLNMRGLEA